MKNENEFKPLSWWKEFFLKNDQLAEYYLKKREYEYTNKTFFKNNEWKNKLHPLLLKLISLNRKYLDRQNLKILSDKRSETNKPVIYAITHIGKFDYQLVSEAIKDHQYPFAGDPETMYRTLDGLFLGLNGIIYCDTESKTDRKIAKETAINTLKNGNNLLIYPEGIWNVSSNLLTLPLFPGVIDMALETDCEIVPVAIEQYDKDFIVNIGSNFKLSQQDSLLNRDEYIDNKKNELRDIMATLKLEILESRPIVKRSDLASYNEEKETFTSKILNEWVNPKTKIPYYNEEILKHRTFKIQKIAIPNDAFSYFKDIKINKNNLFCFKKDDSLPTDTQTIMDEKIAEYLKNIKMAKSK